MVFDRWIRSRWAKTLPRPVISVGNLTVGGTGKTPLLIRLVHDLENLHIRPAILTRGYGQDEIQLMREKCPKTLMGVGANRVAKGNELAASNDLNVFLLDDGFQHWPLLRSLDIVCVDAASSFETETLLPAGRLREPWSSLSRAGIAAVTRANMVSSERLTQLKNKIQMLTPRALVIGALFEKQLKLPGETTPVPLDFLKGKEVVAVCAIGNPAAFEQSLSSAGASVTSLRFRDHYEYQEKDVLAIQKLAKEKNALVVTTEKDWMKLRKWKVDWVVVELSVSFSREDEKLWLSTIAQVVR